MEGISNHFQAQTVPLLPGTKGSCVQQRKCYMIRLKRGSQVLLAVAGIAALSLTGCTGPAAGQANVGASGGSLTVGTTDKVTSLDPAGSYDYGSIVVENQIYPFVLNPKPGSATPVPDLAESASFTSPTEYTVKLKTGLKWANGDTLDSTDVKFSFDRQLKIADPNGPSSLLGNLASVDAPDAATVVFHLKTGNDQTFPQILASPAGPIVDHKVFPADRILSDDEIVKAKAFAGQYTIASYTKNELISFKAFPGYGGVLGKAATDNVNLKFYADSNNLKLDLQQGNIDVDTARSQSATDITDLKKDGNVKVYTGAGGDSRFLVFNFDTMPFGAKTPQADPKKALAVRQAVANLIDRQAIDDQVFKGTFVPDYSFVPQGIPGAKDTLKTQYGDGTGKPSLEKAKADFAAAGISGPVSLDLQYNTDHYGKSSSDAFSMIKDQLEKSGLFKVNLQSTEWVTYVKDKTKDVYPVYQLGWYPDYSEADNYLTPFFLPTGFLHSHYQDAKVTDLITAQVTNPDKASRDAQISEIQDGITADLPTLPLFQGSQIVVAGTAVKGVQSTLDASFKFRLGVLSK
jgi:peptide/nickel transport system substrate-binding protein